MKLSDKAQAALDAVVAQFQSGDLSPLVEIARIRPDPACAIPSDRWSFGNRVLAYMQTRSLDCRGFQQWHDAGRHVKAGSRAAFILAPCTYEDKETGESRLRGFRAVAVFSVEDTDGAELPAASYAPANLPPLADLAASWGVKVTYLPATSGAYGSCATDGSRIHLGSQDAQVFFHELGHAGHARLQGRLKGGQDVEQETVAEFISAVLMHLYGLGDRTGNAWDYIKGYAGDPLTAVTRALATVEQVLGLLLGTQ